MNDISNIKLTRREFLKLSSLLFFSFYLPIKFKKDNFSEILKDYPQLVALEGVSLGDIENSLDIGFKAFGIKRFIRGLVVIKPNLAFATPPDLCATVHPSLLYACAKLCYKYGAKKVIICEHTIDHPDFCLELTGAKKAARSSGAVIYMANDKKFYKLIKINKKALKEVYVIKDILSADVVISLAKLKHHVTTNLTACMKNLIGACWDMKTFHLKNLHQAIFDIASYIRPHISILDATYCLLTNGPRGPGKIKNLKKILISSDIVAIDSYGAELLGFNPLDIGYLRISEFEGFGKVDYNKLKILNIAL